MLGYSVEDIENMINSVHDAKLFYLRYPSDLMDKDPLVNGLLETVSFLQGLIEEGRI
jgi:hypothetical protein